MNRFQSVRQFNDPFARQNLLPSLKLADIILGTIRAETGNLPAKNNRTKSLRKTVVRRLL